MKVVISNEIKVNVLDRYHRQFYRLCKILCWIKDWKVVYFWNSIHSFLLEHYLKKNLPYITAIELHFKYFYPESFITLEKHKTYNYSKLYCPSILSFCWRLFISLNSDMVFKLPSCHDNISILIKACVKYKIQPMNAIINNSFNHCWLYVNGKIVANYTRYPKGKL